MNIHPIWSKELETITGHSYIEIVKCLNLLLDNYNEVNIGEVSYPTSEIFGKQPYVFKNIMPETLMAAEILNCKNQNSVSPRKSTSIAVTPYKLTKIRSTYGNKSKDFKKESYYSQFLDTSPTGILEPKKSPAENRYLENQGMTEYLKMFHSDSISNSDSEENDEVGVENAIQEKRVSFESHISIKHGSK